MMTESKHSPEKTKYLKRMARLAKHTEQKVAARQNRIERDKVQAQAREALHARIEAEGPHQFTYSEQDLAAMEKIKMMKLPMDLQTALVMGKLQAEREREQELEKQNAQVLEASSEQSVLSTTEELKAESPT